MILNDLDAAVVLKAQTRILRLKAKMTWRDVADVLAVRGGLAEMNVSIAWSFVIRNVVPSNRSLRRALGLPKFLPSERKMLSRALRHEPKGLFSFPAFRKVAREDVLEELESMKNEK